MTLTPLITGALLLAGYAGWALRRDQPALDLSLARRAVPALSMALSSLASVVTWAAVFLLRPDQLGDANTLFNTWQRIAGSFGIGALAND